MATKIPYKTPLSKHEHYYAPSGEKFEMRHTAHMDAEGRRYLKPDKRVEIYELIQSHAEECDINNIINRALNGDPFALNKKIGNYMDLTEMPKTLAEAQQIVINLKEGFDKLPAEVRAKFENNAEMYVASYGTDTWAEKVGWKETLAQKEAKEKIKAEFAETYKKAITNLAEGGNTNEQK